MEDFDLGGLLGGLFSTQGINDLVGGISGIYGLQEAQDRARALGPTVQEQLTGLAQTAGEMKQFQPFTVTSTTPQLGGLSISEQGVGLQTGAPQQRITEQALTGAETALQGLLASPEAQRAQILSEFEAARAPARERDMLAEEQRLLAQGRLGTQSSMFGGTTPERFSRLQAIEEQRARDALSARTQVGQEQERAQNLLSGLLGTAYTPQTQALNLLQGTIPAAQIAQAGRLGAGEALQAAVPYVGQATVSGEETAADLASQELQALVGLLSPTIQTAGQAIGAQDIATQTGQAVQGGLEDLYNAIFGG